MSPKPMDVLKTYAQGLPDVQKGVACEGTAVERTTFKAKKKAFLFLGAGDAMVKLKKWIEESYHLMASKPAVTK